MAENGEQVTYFGETDARGKRVKFGIKAKDRTKHMYVIGKTGMGKSTLLENMAIQDIQNGEGLAFVDPHGSSAEKLLDYIPEERINDVLYFAPFDLGHPVSFNILEDMGADKRHLVVNGLMSTFEKLWVDMWSARMSYILQNTIQALLEYPDSTLLGINRVLVDKNYRKKVVDNVKDPAVKAFWIEEFAKYTDRYTQEATPAIQNKVGQFVSNPLIRNIIGQPDSAFNIREIMDKKKILIANLAKGKVGEGNANLLGGMLITRIYLAAMSRADASERELAKLPNFNLYVDEFQSFANKTFENILSEARKYKLNLTIAHQYIEQMEEEVRNAVFGNVGTMVCFRVGAYDAEVLEKEFAPTFYADNLVNLGVYQIYLKLMIDGVSSAPFSAVSMLPIPPPALSYREQIIEHTRTHFGRPRAEVEAEIKRWHEAIMPDEVLKGTSVGASGTGAGGGGRGVMGGSAEGRRPRPSDVPAGKPAGGLGWHPDTVRTRDFVHSPGGREGGTGFSGNRDNQRENGPPRTMPERPVSAGADARQPLQRTFPKPQEVLSRTREVLEKEIRRGDGRGPVSLKDLKKHTQHRDSVREGSQKKFQHNRGHAGAVRSELRDALQKALAVAPIGSRENPAAAALPPRRDRSDGLEHRQDNREPRKAAPRAQPQPKPVQEGQKQVLQQERKKEEKPKEHLGGSHAPQQQEHKQEHKGENKRPNEVPEATLRKILE